MEKNFGLYEASMADECFMTATPFCLLPVTTINGLPIGNRKIGQITQILHDQWSENVGVDIYKQIKGFSDECKTLNSQQPTPYQFVSSDD